jgi:hypothetical protein
LIVQLLEGWYKKRQREQERWNKVS